MDDLHSAFQIYFSRIPFLAVYDAFPGTEWPLS